MSPGWVREGSERHLGQDPPYDPPKSCPRPPETPPWIDSSRNQAANRPIQSADRVSPRKYKISEYKYLQRVHAQVAPGVVCQSNNDDDLDDDTDDDNVDDDNYDGNDDDNDDDGDDDDDERATVICSPISMHAWRLGPSLEDAKFQNTTICKEYI